MHINCLTGKGHCAVTWWVVDFSFLKKIGNTFFFIFPIFILKILNPAEDLSEYFNACSLALHFIHQLLTFNLPCALFPSLLPSFSPVLRHQSLSTLSTEHESPKITRPQSRFHPRKFTSDTVYHLIHCPVQVSPVIPSLYNDFYYPGSCIMFHCHVTLDSFNLEQFSRLCLSCNVDIWG